MQECGMGLSRPAQKVIMRDMQADRRFDPAAVRQACVKSYVVNVVSALRVAAFMSAAAVATAAFASAAPQTTAPAAKPDQPASKTVTLTGCVEKGATPNQFTLQDPLNGKYEVSGNGISKYLGQRVQVAGTRGSSRFRVKGG